MHFKQTLATRNCFVFIGGLGPVRTGGSIQGFGNTPTSQTSKLNCKIVSILNLTGAD